MFRRLIRLFFAQKKHYQSDVQKHLNDWDREHSWTESQTAEIKKHNKLHHLRDQATHEKKQDPISWLEKDND